MQVSLFPMRLLEVREIAPGVKQFVLQFDSEKTFSYEPGQFITIHFEARGKLYRRSYSIANSPTDTREKLIEFAASYVAGGVASEFLFHLATGQTLNIAGPYGRLILKAPYPARYILVGTGTGIVPYLSMLPKLATMIQACPSLQVMILEGVRAHEDALYVDIFRAFVKQHPAIQFQLCLSRPVQQNLGEGDHLGRVQTLFSELSLDPKRDLVYLCGNPNMIDEAFALLIQQGFETKQIIREKYISHLKG